MSSGAWALIGVVVGGLLAGLWQWLSLKAKRNDDRRSEKLDLTAEFLRDVDLMWRAAGSLDVAVTELHNSKGAIGEERRMAAFELSREPTFRSGVALAKFEIFAPKLVAPARELRTASEKFTHTESGALNANRDAMLAAFLKGAREEIA